jgi:para-nitrobenzyl esterase
MGAEVRTAAGRVRGFVEGGAHVFLGVPFAEPPVGTRRLLAPVAAEAWDGVREAVAYGATSQRPEDEMPIGIPEPSIPGDDILTVNVFTPDPGAGGLPVIVWLHGGGFYAGSPASPWYRGHGFARDGVVLVSAGYRLGAEGFLALEGAPANRAVLDWIAALEWVQQNIAAFGGDPGNVTIAGQSAGGIACTTLLATPRADGLFHRAISMSAPNRTVLPEEAAAIAHAVTERLGVAARRDEVAALPVEDLHTAQLAFRVGGGAPLADDAREVLGMMPFAPIIDGDLLAERPLDALAAGRGRAVDLMVGCAHDEVDFGVTSAALTLDEEGLARALTRRGLPPEEYRRLHADLSPPEVLGWAVTDHLFRNQVQRVATARATGGGRTFVYEFRWPSPLSEGRLRACHCIDIPFAFDLLGAEDVPEMLGPAPPQALADLIHGAWVRFATTGDPGWPEHDLGRRAMMLFDVESGPVDDPLAAERRLWPG